MSELDERVARARAAYADRRPRSAAASRAAAHVLPGGSTRSVLDTAPFPLKVASAHGSRLVDLDGHEYVDLLGDYSAGLLGHSPPAIAAAVQVALERGWSYGATHELEAELAWLVCERFPSIEQVRFTNSGTEANLMAIATARAHTGRAKVLVFDGAYHGGALVFAPGGEATRAPFPFAVCRYNDLTSVAMAFEAEGAEIALVLVEPMLGAGGCIPASPAFLAGLRAVCDANGALLVFDEVMTSRMSAGGGQQRLGITPDMTTLGKYLAGGMTFGAFGGRRDVMAVFDPARGGRLGHGGTFNNNVVSLAAGVEVLSNHLPPALLDDLFARGEALRARINEATAAADAPVIATGWGSLLNLHPVGGGSTSAAVTNPDDLAHVDPRARELLWFGLLERGFYVAPRGYLALSLAITDDDLDRFTGALVDVARTLGPDPR
jgi:glutamate-1-semialdehyde 2,1-aminomutase